MQSNLQIDISDEELSQQESFIKSIAMRNIIPPKVMQKLKFLQLCLHNKNQRLDESEFDLINPDELNSLNELPCESKRSLFLNIVNTFNQPTKLYGQAFILGKSGYFWDLRKIELDIEDNILKIQRKNKRSDARLIELINFDLNICERQDKLSFIIKEQDIIQNKRNFTLGFDSKDEYTYWYKNIKTCCKYKPGHNNSINSRTSYVRLQISLDEKNSTQSKINDINFSKSTIDLDSTQIFKGNSSNKTPLNRINSQSPLRKTIVQVPEILKFPPIFEDLKVKATLDFLKSDVNFHSVMLNDQISICQNTENSNHYKVIVNFPNFPIETILNYLLDPQLIMQWNQNIEFTKLKLILNEDLFLIEEKHKCVGSLYRSRYFHLMRYVVKDNQGQIYIYEKSVDTQDQLYLWSSTSGKVHWAIYGIYPTSDQKYTMILQIQTTNGGFLTKYQEQNMTLIRLTQFQYLRAFLKKIQKVDQIAKLQSQTLSKKILKQLDFVQEERKSILKKEQQNDDKYDLYYLNASDKILNYIDRVMLSNKELLQLLRQVEQNIHWSLAIHFYEQGILKQYNDEKFMKTEDGYHFFYCKEWNIDQKKGVLKFIDQSKLDQQKKVFKYLLVQIGSNLVQGKSILNISLPIIIFEKRSNLERYAQSYNYAPYYLERAAQLQDPVEQMKLVVAFGITTIISYLTLEKPFNPILGETYQGYIKGCPIYLEQISHHPPILALLMIGRGYKIYCTEEQYASMGANSVVGGNIGCINIQFLETGNTIKYHICAGVLGGVTIGDRIFYLEGKSWFIDQKNKIIADMEMNPSKGFFSKQKYPLDQVLGGIYKIDDIEIERFNHQGCKKYQGLNNYQYQKLMEINGRFHQSLKIGEDEVFNIMKDYPYYLINHPSPLASDCKYREDVIAWKLNDEQLGTERKEKLENIQRNDRKLRAKLGFKQH